MASRRASGTSTHIEGFALSEGNFTTVTSGTWGSNNGAYVLSATAIGMETDRNPNQAIHWMAIRGDFVEEVDFIGTGSSGTYNNVSIIFDRVDHLNYSASFNELANTATNGFFRIPVRIQ